MEPLTRQQLRTQETRKRLLDAAERVFVRDGFEAAQIDAIAAAAGRSKGAVYTHFSSKDDLFLALYEHRTRAIIRDLVLHLRGCANREQSFKAFREFYVGQAGNRAWPILTLEFKLYALRHPEAKTRLQQAFELSKSDNDESAYAHMFGRRSAKRRRSDDMAFVSLEPIFSGLILESNFEPEILSGKNLRHLLAQIFDTLFALKNASAP